MPKQGYTVITISNETKSEIEKIAEKTGESLPEVIKRLLKENSKGGC